MSDLGLEAIKALDLESYFDALLREWYDGVVQRGDGAALVADLRARGLEVDALVAEVERLRAVEMAVKRACTHDAHCEEEGEGACCFRAWRAVVLAAGCAQAVTHEDVELLAALHPQEPSDE